MQFADIGDDGCAPCVQGAEGVAWPCVDRNSQSNAWLKIPRLAGNSDHRTQRMQWLIAQRPSTWAKELEAAPRLWLDTRDCSRPDGAGFDFAGYLSHAASGFTWLELRSSVCESGLGILDEWRQQWVEQLLQTLTTLEQHRLVHGDLSPNNLVLCTTGQPQLRLIDFDGFHAPDAPNGVGRLTNDQGGIVGTPGYLPCDLERMHSNGNGNLAPYSDLRARDMLLIELLCFDGEFPEEDAPEQWDWSRIQSKLQLRCPPAIVSYLGQRDVIMRSEDKRASSMELARALAGSPSPKTARPTAAVSPQTTFQTPRIRNQFSLPVDWQQQTTDNNGTFGVLASTTASSMPDADRRSPSGLRSILWGLCVLYWALATCLTLFAVLRAAGFNEITAAGMLATITVGWIGIRRATSVAFGENYPVTYQVSRWRLTLAPWRSLSNPPTNAERIIRLLLCICLLHFLFRRLSLNG